MVWGKRYREGLLQCLPAPPGPIVLLGDWLCWWRVLGGDWLQAVGADGGHVMRGGWETWERGREGGRREEKRKGEKERREEGGRGRERERRKGKEKRRKRGRGKRRKEKHTIHLHFHKPILLLIVADILKR